MPANKVGGRDVESIPTAPAQKYRPEPPTKKIQGNAHSTRNRRRMNVPVSRGLRTTLLVLAGLSVITAAIVGAGRLADLVPAAVVALCVVVLLVMCLVGLART